MINDNLDIENDTTEIEEVVPFDATGIFKNGLYAQPAIPSDEFLNMNNNKSFKVNKIANKLINANKKKLIFSFGKEDPELLDRYGHLLSVKKYINLANELSSNECFYSFPANNPFLLSIGEYEETPSRLNFSNIPQPAVQILAAFDPKFTEELFSIIEIAFEVNTKKASDEDIKRRNNSINVVIMLAIINTCGNVDMRHYLSNDAIKSVAFMIVLDAVCELIDHLRNKVTHVI